MWTQFSRSKALNQLKLDFFPAATYAPPIIFIKSQNNGFYRMWYSDIMQNGIYIIYTYEMAIKKENVGKKGRDDDSFSIV